MKYRIKPEKIVSMGEPQTVYYIYSRRWWWKRWQFVDYEYSHDEAERNVERRRHHDRYEVH